MQACFFWLSIVESVHAIHKLLLLKIIFKLSLSSRIRCGLLFHNYINRFCDCSAFRSVDSNAIIFG